MRRAKQTKQTPRWRGAAPNVATADAPRSTAPEPAPAPAAKDGAPPAPPWKTKGKPRRDLRYEVSLGAEELRPVTHMYGYRRNTLNCRFWGKCFLCHAPGHSQKFCATRRCAVCGGFGHAESVCPGGTDRDSARVQPGRA